MGDKSTPCVSWGTRPHRLLCKGSLQTHGRNGLVLWPLVPRDMHTGDGTTFAPRLQKHDPTDDKEEPDSQESTTLFFPSCFWGEEPPESCGKSHEQGHGRRGVELGSCGGTRSRLS